MFAEEKEYKLHTIRQQCAVALEEIVEEINALGREVIFLGDGVPVFAAQLEEKVKVPFSYAAASCNRQRAAAIGTLALRYLREGKIQRSEEHQPEYLRLSQAERERNEEMKCGNCN